MRRNPGFFRERRESARPGTGTDFRRAMVTEILYRSAAMCTEPQGLVLPSDPGRISIARRMPRGVIGVISPFKFPADPVDSARSRRRSPPATRSCSSPIRARALTGGFIIARIFEEAELPKGVLQVLPGGAEAGEAICTDPDIAMVVVHRFEQCRPPHRRAGRQTSQESAA